MVSSYDRLGFALSPTPPRPPRPTTAVGMLIHQIISFWLFTVAQPSTCTDYPVGLHGEGGFAITLEKPPAQPYDAPFALR